MPGATEDLILGLDSLQALKATFSCAGLVARCKPKSTGYAPTDNNSRTSQVKVSNISNTCRNLEIPVPFRQDLEGLSFDQERVNRFLEKELTLFKKIQGVSNIAQHRIQMKDDQPIKLRYAPRNPAMQAIIDEEINTLIRRGCIEPSRSPYSFPITLVRKKNGTWRTCMDFRQLNARSVL